VRGSLLFPEVSGKVAISDGRVIIGEQSPADGKNVEKDQFNIGFNNLLVTLANNIQVTRSPLLNLLASGELLVNGSLNDIRPSGRVKIGRGQINTISTRLRIDRDFENYADFVASQGLNPNLNVRVLGSIPEVTRSRIDDSPIDAFNPTNVPITNLGAQRTIQIQATVTGSVQSPKIDLRSSPPRTQSEILTLVGGGLLQQGGSDPTAVLANLAGGTIIGVLQDAIGEALDLAEFNLTPTTTNTRGGGLSTIGVAAEAAITLNPSFSFAIRSVLNDPSQVTSYTLRYRANPNTLVLTNTDLSGNNSVSVEYEARF
jgi:translocation and assembly module TamB